MDIQTSSAAEPYRIYSFSGFVCFLVYFFQTKNILNAKRALNVIWAVVAAPC